MNAIAGNQMYRVKFTRNGNETVETGEAILNAKDQAEAIAITAHNCGLSATSTQFDVTRVKPAFVMLRRANVERHMATYEATTVAVSLASGGTFPRSDRPEREIYAVKVSAELHADSETDAIEGVSRVITRHTAGKRQRSSLREFDVACDRVEKAGHVSRYDENANLSVHRFVQGGAARPR